MRITNIFRTDKQSTNPKTNKIIVGISGSYLDDGLVEKALEIADDQTEICMLYVIIIPKSKALDIEDEKSFSRAENVLKKLETKFKNKINIYGEIIQSRHAGAAIIEIADINNPSLLLIGANENLNSDFIIGSNASYILKNTTYPTLIYKK